MVNSLIFFIQLMATTLRCPTCVSKGGNLCAKSSVKFTFFVQQPEIVIMLQFLGPETVTKIKFLGLEIVKMV